MENAGAMLNRCSHVGKIIGSDSELSKGAPEIGKQWLKVIRGGRDAVRVELNEGERNRLGAHC
jgi:hypothetical protein